MWSLRELCAPVAVLVAVSLQGCALEKLKPAVQIAIGHGCEEKANAVSDAAGLKEIAKAKGCDDMDAEKLKEFGVDDCPHVLHQVIHTVVALDCESLIGNEVEEDCFPWKDNGETKCKSKLTSTFDRYSSEEVPEEPGEDKEGAEQLVGLVHACGSKANETMHAAHAKEQFEAECGKIEQDGTLEGMGISEDHCTHYVERSEIIANTIKCAITYLSNPETAADPSLVTPESINEHATTFFAGVSEHLASEHWTAFDKAEGHGESEEDDGEEDGEEDGETDTPDEPERLLKLFAEVMRARKWRKIQVMPRSKDTLLGGMSVTALVAVAAVGFGLRRRHAAAPQSRGRSPEEEELIPE